VKTLSLDFALNDSGLTLHDLIASKRELPPGDERDKVRDALVARIEATGVRLNEPSYKLLGLILGGMADREICSSLRIRPKTLDQMKGCLLREIKGVLGIREIPPGPIEAMPGFDKFHAAMKHILSLTPEEAADVRSRSKMPK
jgi:hypothetical protein